MDKKLRSLGELSTVYTKLLEDLGGVFHASVVLNSNAEIKAASDCLSAAIVEVNRAWEVLRSGAMTPSALQAFREAVVGWREFDHPEWFDRRTAEYMADLGREAEQRQRG